MPSVTGVTMNGAILQRSFSENLEAVAASVTVVKATDGLTGLSTAVVASGTLDAILRAVDVELRGPPLGHDGDTEERPISNAHARFDLDDVDPGVEAEPANPVTRADGPLEKFDGGALEAGTAPGPALAAARLMDANAVMGAAAREAGLPVPSSARADAALSANEALARDHAEFPGNPARPVERPRGGPPVCQRCGRPRSPQPCPCGAGRPNPFPRYKQGRG